MRRITLLCLISGAITGCGRESASVSNVQFVLEGELQRHAEAESKVPAYAKLAWGSADLERFSRQARHPWPVNLLSIGHTMASYQNYGSSPYFHHGIDIRANAGSDVIASVGGKVVNIENYMSGSAYWEVAILDDEGYLWQYHHVERSSIPSAVMNAYRTGGRVVAGDKIGEVYYWSVSAFGERFHHIHLNVLAEGGRYVNPFAFLEPLDDSQAPQVVDIGLMKNGRRVQGTSVSGTYSVFAKVHDLIQHQRFVVPAYSLQFSLNGAEPQTVWQFDGLPGGTSDKSYVHNYFVSSMTCGNYSCRELAVDLGFSPNGSLRFPTSSGQHTLEVIAKDFAGNETRRSYSWNVQ